MRERDQAWRAGQFVAYCVASRARTRTGGNIKKYFMVNKVFDDGPGAGILPANSLVVLFLVPVSSV
jgi:hypothetical protein